MTTLITPEYLLPYRTPDTTPEVNDYRCVVNKAGNQVIFERAPYDAATKKTGSFRLYLLTLAGDNSPSPLFSTPIAHATNRPDWFWGEAGTVAFDYIPVSAGDTVSPVMVATAKGNGDNPDLFGSATSGMNYPTWFANGASLAVMNAPTMSAPSLAIIASSNGAIQAENVQGPTMWSGMPSVRQAPSTDQPLIAFAGQPQAWGPYHQDHNYIWVVDTSVSPPQPTPLEFGALQKTDAFDRNFQARAPWWSPDGKWVVFESNRLSPPNPTNKNGMYAIFLYEYGTQGKAIQVTDPSYDCNHAKWYPNGFNNLHGPFKLIVAAYQTHASAPAYPYGLASLDLTPLKITF
jgi:WD40-like Beta Propeller Repeat